MDSCGHDAYVDSAGFRCLRTIRAGPAKALPGWRIGYAPLVTAYFDVICLHGIRQVVEIQSLYFLAMPSKNIKSRLK